MKAKLRNTHSKMGGKSWWFHIKYLWPCHDARTISFPMFSPAQHNSFWTKNTEAVQAGKRGWKKVEAYLYILSLYDKKYNHSRWCFNLLFSSYSEEHFTPLTNGIIFVCNQAMKANLPSCSLCPRSNSMHKQIFSVALRAHNLRPRTRAMASNLHNKNT